MSTQTNFFSRGALGAARLGLYAVAGVLLASSGAMAASSSATGIDAAFTSIQSDFSGMMDGNFGSLLIIVATIAAGAGYIITRQFGWLISAAVGALVIGYGEDMLQGVGGVTATTDMVIIAELDPLPADPVAFAQLNFIQ